VLAAALVWWVVWEPEVQPADRSPRKQTRIKVTHLKIKPIVVQGKRTVVPKKDALVQKAKANPAWDKDGDGAFDKDFTGVMVLWADEAETILYEKYYYEHGRLMKQEYFHDSGILETRLIFYDFMGRDEKSVSDPKPEVIIEGSKKVHSISYFEDGKVEAEAFYKEVEFKMKASQGKSQKSISLEIQIGPNKINYRNGKTRSTHRYNKDGDLVEKLEFSPFGQLTLKMVLKKGEKELSTIYEAASGIDLR